MLRNKIKTGTRYIPIYKLSYKTKKYEKHKLLLELGLNNLLLRSTIIGSLFNNLHLIYPSFERD